MLVGDLPAELLDLPRGNAEAIPYILELLSGPHVSSGSRDST
jgi:hypothetical protein